MKKFNVDSFLSDTLAIKNNLGTGLVCPSIETGMSIEADDTEITASAIAFLGVVFDFLNSKCDTDLDYTQYYEINASSSKFGISLPDHIVMHEHGIMDSPDPVSPGEITLTDAVMLQDDITHDYVYIADELVDV
jgi:hypothetical protein